MTEKPRLRPGQLAIDLTFGEGGQGQDMTIRFHWTTRPFQRAQEKFKALEGWLKEIGKFDWDGMEGVAMSYHPDYQPNPETGQADELTDRGRLFLEMEKHDFKPAVIRAFAPELLSFVPSGARGTPGEFLFMILLVSASLACYEFLRLSHEMGEAEPNELVLSRRLYWFERFYSLWRFTAASKPPQWDNVIKKRSAAKGWRSRLSAHIAAYVSRHPKASLRQAVAAFYPEGTESRQFMTAYRWALSQARHSQGKKL